MNVSLILDRRFEVELFWTTVYLQAHATNKPQEGGPISERRLLSARRLLLEQGTVLSSQVNLINDGMDQYKKTIPQGKK